MLVRSLKKFAVPRRKSSGGPTEGRKTLTQRQFGQTHYAGQGELQRRASSNLNCFRISIHGPLGTANEVRKKVGGRPRFIGPQRGRPYEPLGFLASPDRRNYPIGFYPHRLRDEDGEANSWFTSFSTKPPNNSGVWLRGGGRPGCGPSAPSLSFSRQFSSPREIGLGCCRFATPACWGHAHCWDNSPQENSRCSVYSVPKASSSETSLRPADETALRKVNAFTAKGAFIPLSLETSQCSELCSSSINKPKLFTMSLYDSGLSYSWDHPLH